MMMLSFNEMLPYLALGVLIIGLLFIRSRKLLTLLLGIPILVAFMYDIVTPMGLLPIGIFWGLCELHWCNPTSKEWLNSIRLIFLVGIALGFANHLIPGFHNLKAFTDLQISASSSPFTMYFNFDKTIAAAILAVAGSIFLKQRNSFGMRSLSEVIKISILCVTLLIPIAVLNGYVMLDPKFPKIFWLWAINNLVFVCFAEEVIFRGIIQNYLTVLARRYLISPFIPILVTSLFFGTLLLGHMHGGIAYIAFATISGAFYGYAYHITGRLEAAILVHFLVNLTHFLLFSYPMAVQ